MKKGSNKKTAARKVDKDVILITGQPGIKKVSSLKKIIKKREDRSCDIEIIDFESLMVEEYKKKNTGLNSRTKTEIIYRILEEPPLTQKENWREAFKVLEEKIGNPTNKKIYLVSLHTVFYHQRLKQFISPIDLEKLKDVKPRVKNVVLLIDDAFDSYRRLIQKGEMFELKDEDNAFEATKKSVRNVTTILYWREIETTTSNVVADYLRVPIFVVAVKHPAFMIARIFTKRHKELRFFYLAHPITHFRESYSPFIRNSDYPSHLQIFAEKILKEVPNLILFVPDTIDEYCFKGITDKDIEWFDPWPVPFGQDKNEWAFVKIPTKLAETDPIFIKGKRMSANQKVRICALVNQLAELLFDQITSRDLNLVTQSSNGIIVFRPHWNGASSSGAEDEAEYNYGTLIKKRCEKKRKTYVIEDSNNIAKLRIRKLLYLFVTSLKKPKISEDTTDMIIDQWFEDDSMLESFYKDTWDRDEIRKKIELAIPNFSTCEFEKPVLKDYKSGLPSAEATEKQNRLDYAWEKIEQEVKGFHAFEIFCSNPDEEYLVCDPEDFEKTVTSFISRLG